MKSSWQIVCHKQKPLNGSMGHKHRRWKSCSWEGPVGGSSAGTRGAQGRALAGEEGLLQSLQCSLVEDSTLQRITHYTDCTLWIMSWHTAYGDGGSFRLPICHEESTLQSSVPSVFLSEVCVSDVQLQCAVCSVWLEEQVAWDSDRGIFMGTSWGLVGRLPTCTLQWLTMHIVHCALHNYLPHCKLFTAQCSQAQASSAQWAMQWMHTAQCQSWIPNCKLH